MKERVASMSTFRRLLGYTLPYWRLIAVSLVGAVGVAASDSAIAFSVGKVLKKVFSEDSHEIAISIGPLLSTAFSVDSLSIFRLLPFALIALFLFRGVCRYIQQFCITYAGQLGVQDIRNEIYQRNMRLSLRFFNNHPTGVLMARVLNDVSMMQNGLSEVLMSIFRDTLTALGLLGLVFYLDWKLAIITLVVVPLMIFPTKIIGRHLKRLAKLGLERLSDISCILQETFSGIKVIKAFSLEDREINRFQAANLLFLNFARKTLKYQALHTPIMEVITSFGIAGVIWFGGSHVLSGQMGADAFISFVVAMGMIYSPIKKLLNVYSIIQRSLGAAERVFEIIDETPDIVDGPDALSLGRARGEVAFRDVCFAYNNEQVLSTVNLSAKKGEVVALVGPSGGGKTTLVSLLPRFYDVGSGSITIDGIDIRSLKLADLLQQIALVDQETILFNETIANNIKYGRTDASDEEVERAARAAYAHDFIMEMPDGYKTNIGDRGVRLSGGQKQRLCIARAILKNAPILILDEATSALDTESEQMVQQAINNLMSNRTTFVIAHRLSTILHADTIAVLDKGVVVERGSHQQLLESGGLYKKLYDMQFQGEGTDVRSKM
ncbi:MAG: lipid A export permease/ATP-binding protein MsbA [Geobacteraceae bacterium]|nr:lipid A export permease/ATP-binding protein MsbA [Geobacteraceae bacterium]